MNLALEVAGYLTLGSYFSGSSFGKHLGKHFLFISGILQLHSVIPNAATA
jgi:hypothetical protein